MDITSLHESNKFTWDLTALKYEQVLEGEAEFLRNGGNSLKPCEQRLLHDLGAWCHRAIHLQCAGGVDTLSLWRQGAKEVVGVDISPRMIAVAKRKGEIVEAPAQWVVSDILNTPSELDGSADLVYTGCGAIYWMMDIQAWANVVARLLKPGGRFFLYEGHPLDWVWDTESETFQFDSEHGYYFAEKLSDKCWPRPYFESEETLAEVEPQVRAKQWTLGEVINSLLGAGLRLRHFDEYPEPFWNQFENIPTETQRRLPHSYTLYMEK